jgi:hypothetical protein
MAATTARATEREEHLMAELAEERRSKEQALSEAETAAHEKTAEEVAETLRGAQEEMQRAMGKKSARAQLTPTLAQLTDTNAPHGRRFPSGAERCRHHPSTLRPGAVPALDGGAPHRRPRAPRPSRDRPHRERAERGGAAPASAAARVGDAHPGHLPTTAQPAVPPI